MNFLSLIEAKREGKALANGGTAKHFCLVARPHPGPLPRGEGETVAACWERRVAGLVGRVVGWIEMGEVKTLSRGRGQGEGERLNQFYPRHSFGNAT